MWCRALLAALPTLAMACVGYGVDAECSCLLPDASEDAAYDCDALRSDGCGTSAKCTWIVDSTTGDGVIGCAPHGPARWFDACTYAPVGGTNVADNCNEGTVCVHGTCHRICEVGAPCPYDFECLAHDAIFPVESAIGVCESPASRHAFVEETSP